MTLYLWHIPAIAIAAPGLGSKVYGTGVEQGEFELEQEGWFAAWISI